MNKFIEKGTGVVPCSQINLAHCKHHTYLIIICLLQLQFCRCLLFLLQHGKSHMDKNEIDTDIPAAKMEMFGMMLKCQLYHISKAFTLLRSPFEISF